MNLVIRALSLNDRPLTQAIGGAFDDRGGTIGRSDSNTLALPDPERHISRLQAEVFVEQGRYRIRNAGGANPILLNGQAIAPGAHGPLVPGDELRIGGYLLRAFDAADPDSMRTITRPRPPVDARTVIAASAREVRTDPPMARPAGTATAPVVPVAAPATTPTATPLNAPVAAVAAPASAAPATDQTNPFGDLLGSGAPAGVADPFADLLGHGNATAGYAQIDPFAGLASPPPAPAHAMSAAPTVSAAVASSDLFADLMGSPGSGADPFADLLGSSTAHAPAPAPTGPPADLPVDFDPFAGLTDTAPVMPASSPALAGAGTDLLASVGASAGQAPSIDDMFGLDATPSAGAADPLAAFVSGRPGAGGPPPEETDPLALFADVKPAPAPVAAPTAANHVPEWQAAFEPPRPLSAEPAPVSAEIAEPLEITIAPVAKAAPSPVAEAPPAPLSMAQMYGLSPERKAATAPAPATAATTAIDPFADLLSPVAPPAVEATPPPLAARPVAPAPAPAAAAAAPDALWQAFCEGAGIRDTLGTPLDSERMRLLGQLMRESIEGTLRLVKVRATVKQELHAEVTTIRSRNNNPLKFSPDAQMALEQLVAPPLRGFMPGAAAVQDAMHDLVGHSIGTMAGMRAALSGVLGRFQPQQLEAKLAGKSMMDSLLPMNRKARLWELYLQHHGAISGEAEDDFHTLFGKAFIAAYEAELDRLPHTRAD